MGPLTVVALGACGIPLAKPHPIGRAEYIGYAGMAASVAALCWVIVGGYSGLAAAHGRAQQRKPGFCPAGAAQRRNELRFRSMRGRMGTAPRSNVLPVICSYILI